jgi:predicted transcriptional regulator
MLPLEGRRSSIDIVWEILRLLRLHEASKTELMYAANLSYRQTQEYLSWLLELGLLDKLEDEGRWASYRATKRGLRLLTNIQNMREMLQGDTGREVLATPELSVREKPYDQIARLPEDILRQQ